MRSAILWVLVPVVVGLAGCPVNTRADCQTVCDWYGQYCTASDAVQSCVDDCMASRESAEDAIDRCVEGNGWGTPNSCQSAGCCVRWVYDDYESRC